MTPPPRPRRERTICRRRSRNAWPAGRSSSGCTLSCPIAGDPTNDGSIVWPDDRKRVLLGTIRLTKVEPNQEELQRSLAFNPTFLTNGIELSDDPLVPLRSAVYALSVAHRH